MRSNLDHNVESVGNTIGAFNSIRHIGFPKTLELVSLYVTLAIALSLISLSSITNSAIILFQLSIGGIILPALIFAIFNDWLMLRRDRIFDFRRLIGIELASLVLLLISLLLCTIISSVIGNSIVWISGFLIGIIASFPLRIFSIVTMSGIGLFRKILAAILPPIIITRVFFQIAYVNSLIPNVSSLSRVGTITVTAGIIISITGSLLIVRMVQNVGVKELGYSPLELFRSFLEHWLRSNPEKLEEKLTALGTEKSIETTILAFSNKIRGKLSTSITVSNYHPGPYRDLGSAGLPSQLKRFLSETIGGVAHVPHSVSNHELNIISRDNIEKLLLAVKMNFPKSFPIETASIMIRKSTGEATVLGQAFGRTVLLIATLAPNDMEDLPEQVLLNIQNEALRLGFHPILVDAHNSISGQTSISSKQAVDIVNAAIKVLDELNMMPQSPISIGSADDPLTQFSLIDGIGPGGLSVTTVKVDKQITCYITIDGNNMEQGFRQMIIERVKQLGVTDGEIMTTDTHLVTGLVRSRLGYYPVGEHLSKLFLLSTIDNTVKRALDNMLDASAGTTQFMVKVGVLGVTAFNSITMFISRIAQRIARSFYVLELVTIAGTILLIYMFM